MLGFCPDKLVWVKFGSISGESVDMEPMLMVKKVLHALASMDSASIPEKHHRSLQMA